MKKILTCILSIVLLTVVLLAGCGAPKEFGVYKFQMGKAESTHMGLYAELKDEKVKDTEGKELGNAFEITIDVPDSAIDPELAILFDGKIKGYYAIGNDLGEGQRRLDVTVTVLDGIFGPGTFVEMPPELLQNFFLVTLADNTLTFVLPVSIDDLIFQCYWYGYDLQVNETAEFPYVDVKIVPVEKHEIGTYPTQEQIDKINETYPLNHDGTLYRSFYALTLPLTKV